MYDWCVQLVCSLTLPQPPPGALGIQKLQSGWRTYM